MEEKIEKIFNSLCKKKVKIYIGDYEIGFLYEDNIPQINDGEEYIPFSVKRNLRKYLKTCWNMKKENYKRDKQDSINTFDEFYNREPLHSKYVYQYFWICLIIQLAEKENFAGDKLIQFYYKLFVQRSRCFNTKKDDFIMCKDDMTKKIETFFEINAKCMNKNIKSNLEKITEEFIYRHKTEEEYVIRDNHIKLIKKAKKLCNCVNTSKNDALSNMQHVVCYQGIDDEGEYKEILELIENNLLLNNDEIYQIWGFRKGTCKKDLLKKRRIYYNKKIICEDKKKKKDIVDRYLYYEILVLQLVLLCSVYEYDDKEKDFDLNSGLLLNSIRMSLLNEMSYCNLAIVEDENKWMDNIERHINEAWNLYSLFYNEIFEYVYYWNESLELTNDNENWNMIAPETRKKILKKLIRK